LLADLKSRDIARRELQRTLGDLEAVAYLGKYYAEKIRGAVRLAEFDRDGRPEQKQAAVEHLHKALENWQNYARITLSQYKPQLLNRIGYVDLHEITPYVEKDIAIAQQWKPGTLKELTPLRQTGDVPFRP